jgi:streptogramin lyase
MKVRFSAAAATFFVLSLGLFTPWSGGSITTRAARSATNAAPPPRLYVANLDTNTITSYPLTASGDVEPSATISANAGSLNHPANEVFDRRGDLWVGNEASNTIVEFTPAQLARSGSPVPHATIKADNDGSLVSPEPHAFDAAGDLWVVNARNDTIVEFTPAQLAKSGSPVPHVTISANQGSLNNPFVPTFDRAGNLWITNRHANNVVEFTPAQLAGSGNPLPNITISSIHRILYNPYTPDFDSSGNLWVTNQFGNSIVEYTPAQLSGSGSPIPNITISADKRSLDGPVGLVFDSSGDLWVANYVIDTVVEYTPAQLASTGNPVPAVTISGTHSGLHYPVGTAIGR